MITELRNNEYGEESKFRPVFDNTEIPMSLTTIDSQLLEVNGAFCQMLGYSEAEMQNINPAEVTYNADIESSYEYMKSLLLTKLNLNKFEKRYIHKDGRIIWVELNTHILRDIHDHPSYCIANYCDITEKKSYEKKSSPDHSKQMEILKRIDAYRNFLSQSVNQVAEKLFSYGDYSFGLRQASTASIQVIL